MEFLPFRQVCFLVNRQKKIRSLAYAHNNTQFWEPIVNAWQWHLQSGMIKTKENKQQASLVMNQLQPVIDSIVSTLGQCKLDYVFSASKDSVIIKSTRELDQLSQSVVPEQITHVCDFMHPAYVMLFVIEDFTSPTLIFDMDKAFGFSFLKWKQAIAKAFLTNPPNIDLSHLREELDTNHKIWYPLEKTNDFNLLKDIKFMAGDIILFDANAPHAGPGLESDKYGRFVCFTLITPPKDICKKNHFTYNYKDQFYLPYLFWKVHQKINKNNNRIWKNIVKQWSNATGVDINKLLS